ncbi:MAG: Maf family protein [Limnohabitans sp.]|jgi:septum formation protein
MTRHSFVYLASQSPRRKQLLEQLGVKFELLLPDASEDAEALEVVRPNEKPRTYVQRVTALKLEAALQRLKNRGLTPAPVLCSDTTVAIGNTIFAKPDNAEHAKEMLRQLSGQTHRVLTAVSIGTMRKQSRALSISQVRFADLSKQDIDRYVASQEPLGKAGSYAIQGKAAAFISHISGNYSGIMGLPMFETAHLLREFGFTV